MSENAEQQNHQADSTPTLEPEVQDQIRQHLARVNPEVADEMFPVDSSEPSESRRAEAVEAEAVEAGETKAQEETAEAQAEDEQMSAAEDESESESHDEAEQSETKVEKEDSLNEDRANQLLDEFEKRFQMLAEQEQQIRESRRQIEQEQQRLRAIETNPLDYLARQGVTPEKLVDMYLESEGDGGSSGRSKDPIFSEAQKYVDDFVRGRLSAEQLTENLSNAVSTKRHITRRDVEELLDQRIQAQLQQQKVEQALAQYRSSIERAIPEDKMAVLKKFHGDNVVDELYRKADYQCYVTGQAPEPEQVVKDEIKRLEKLGLGAGSDEHQGEPEKKSTSAKSKPKSGISNEMDVGSSVMTEDEVEKLALLDGLDRVNFLNKIAARISRMED